MMVIFFFNSFANIKLISQTSALTLTLAGIVKDLMLVFLSIMVFDSPVTTLQVSDRYFALN